MKTRVLLRLAAECELPDYVAGIRHQRFGLTSVEIDLADVERLREHPGVLGLSMPVKIGRRSLRP